MFGLGDHVGGREVGTRRFVGDDHYLARSCNRVDVDFTIDVLLGQGDEQIAGANNLVDLPDSLDTVGQSSDGLSATYAINFGDAQLVACGQQVGTIGAKFR